MNLTILNTVHATNVIGDTDLDLVLPREQQDSWLSSPESFSKNETIVSAISLPNAQLARTFGKFRKLKEHQLFSVSSQLLSLYLGNCIPAPKLTEYSFWALSCMPSTNSATWPRLACVNVGVMEIFVFGYVKNAPTEMWGFVNVASDVLYDGYKNDGSFLAAHPSIDLVQTEYRDAGQHQIGLHAYDEHSLRTLLEDKVVQKSAAALALRVMRKRATIYGKHHCKQLADLVMTKSN